MDEIVISMYLNDGVGAQTISRKLEIGIHRVYKILKKNNITIRDHKHKNTRRATLNDNFFSKIDTQERAYIIGFIAADGTIIKMKQASAYVKIDLRAKDEDILQKIKDSLNSTRTITHYMSASSYFIEPRPISRLILTGDNLVHDLEVIGITQRKSNTLGSFSGVIPFPLMRHFIRGYFDGDGSWKGNGQDIAWSILGTKELCIDIASHMIKEGLVSRIPTLYKRKPHQTVVSLEYGGRKQCKRIAEWLYKDSIIHLDRKFEKAKLHLCLDLIN